MSAYKRLLNYVRPHLGVLMTAFGFMMLTAVFDAAPLTLIIPLVDRIMADQLIHIPDQSTVPVFIIDLVGKINSMPRLMVLNTVIIAAVCAHILKSISEFAYTYFMSDSSHRVIRDLRSEIYNKLISLPMAFYSKTRTGALVSRITYDTGIVRDAISEGLKDILLQPMQLVMFLAVLLGVRHIFSIPWSFILIIVVVLPIVIYPIIQLGKRLKKISFISQRRMGDINSSLFESIGGIRVVQAFGAEKHEQERFREHNWGYYSAMMSSVLRMLMVRPITAIVIGVCAGLIAILGGRSILYEGMSSGALFAFLGALFSLFRPFKRLSRLHSINQNALAAAERIYEIIDTENTIKECDEPAYIGKLTNAIEFKDIHFQYDVDKPVLRGVNLKIRCGEVVAIVGPSGTGKTTLLNLLPRFYDANQGQVLIDDLPVTKIALKSLRKQIGIVSQETILFNDTVSANIAYGQKKVSMEEVKKAAHIANAHDFIESLPDGYQTLVGDRGFRLSGGEKQRISIARAVFKDPPILILDEATSALDSKSELLVQDAIQNLMRDRTVLVIAHRISTVKGADRIVVLEGGRIREEGNHQELLTRDGLYRKIYELQFQS